MSDFLNILQKKKKRSKQLPYATKIFFAIQCNKEVSGKFQINASVATCYSRILPVVSRYCAAMDVNTNSIAAMEVNTDDITFEYYCRLHVKPLDEGKLAPNNVMKPTYDRNWIPLAWAPDNAADRCADWGCKEMRLDLDDLKRRSLLQVSASTTPRRNWQVATGE